MDQTNQRGPNLERTYLAIMLGNVALQYPIPPEALLVRAQAVPGGEPTTRWTQVEWVLKQMWHQYEEFVLQCKQAFKPRRVKGEPRGLDLRIRFSLRTWKHRGLGKVAQADVRRLRASLLAAENALQARCYEPNTPPIFHDYEPPSMPNTCTINQIPLSLEEKKLVAERLRHFHDDMDTAVRQVNEYIKVLENDVQKRQMWFDNAIKLVTAISGLASALAP